MPPVNLQFDPVGVLPRQRPVFNVFISTPAVNVFSAAFGQQSNQEQRADKVEKAHRHKQRAEADGVGNGADQQGKEEAGDPGAGAAHAVDGRHLIFIERLHHQRAQHAGDHLMAEAADRDQRNRQKRIFGYGDQRQRQHQKRAGNGAGDHRINALEAEPFAIQVGEIAAGDAANIGRREGSRANSAICLRSMPRSVAR